MTGVGVATVVDHQFGSLVVNDGIVVLVGEAGPCGRPTWIQLTTPLPGSGSFLTMIRGWASASPGNTNALSFVGVASGPTGGPDVVLNGAVAARILGPSGGAPGSFDLATASDQGAPDSTCALPPLITPFSPAASSP